MLARGYSCKCIIKPVRGYEIPTMSEYRTLLEAECFNGTKNVASDLGLC
jgi:hypothetical protein